MRAEKPLDTITGCDLEGAKEYLRERGTIPGLKRERKAHQSISSYGYRYRWLLRYGEPRRYGLVVIEEFFDNHFDDFLDVAERLFASVSPSRGTLRLELRDGGVPATLVFLEDDSVHVGLHRVTSLSCVRQGLHGSCGCSSKRTHEWQVVKLNMGA